MSVVGIFKSLGRIKISFYLLELSSLCSSRLLISTTRMKPRLPFLLGNSTSVSYSAVALCLVCVVFGAVPAAAQTTDPSDAAALNTVFAAWGISAGSMGWNVSGELCSGTATDATSFDNNAYNPLIKCDCSFNNGTTCRIAQLKVYAMDVVGPIPDALWNLTYLSNLMVSQNYLTGPLSPSIGNLTRMQYLSLGINALSGPLPKELGLLTDLRSLAFSTNNFSGPLPSELGNLVKLEQIYFDSAGVSGEIPQTFRSLQSLATVWASDNELNGTIPEFIGNWTKLTTLRLQGNNFHGSIPSTFSNLTAMQDLRISDIANGSSSLAFTGNMNSLSTLILRNIYVSGTIPSSIGDLQRLSLLDLSFNNLSSTIPASLFNMSSLSHLFLGNNRLTGSLPAQKASSLANIDLSYNYLSGSFPSWVSSSNLQLNLVANNFTIGGSNSSVLPAGLECLQRNFPCNRGTGIYSDFAIKCGGKQIRSSSNTVFESDSEPLGPATYYVTDTERWAVSNVGRFAENTNASYIVSRSSQFTNTLDSELFQTARISPGSLRYYGLGLENGNYTLSLQFAESVIVAGSSSWKGLGRRRFDVYIQGSLVLKNFDILSAAGGVANSAVKRDFTASVTENYIEVHLFWAGKGTCCVPDQGTYGPLISAISATPNFVPTVANKAPSSDSSNTGMIVGTVVGVAAALIILALVIFCCIRRKSDDNEDEELQLLSSTARPNTFTYSELRTATGDFSPGNKLGEGGFGPVYKGKLSDGRVIAVKQLSVGSHQGKTQFYTEIATISAVQHRNLPRPRHFR
uniref:non-specific serine/threonine protein kinase n=1 Tax=Kalanchoe fedtschenkoi TaxID=63787 RepID=A0A7N0VEN8_KALFE